VKHPQHPEALRHSSATLASHDHSSRRPHPGAATLVDVLDLILDKGLVVAGDIKVSLADIELLTIRIRLIACSIDKARLVEERPPLFAGAGPGFPARRRLAQATALARAQDRRARGAAIA